MATVSRGLMKFEGGVEVESRELARRSRLELAASCLAAAAEQGGMPRIAVSFGGERQLADYLAARVADKRRLAALKVMVITLAEVVGVAAGLYIGSMS